MTTELQLPTSAEDVPGRRISLVPVVVAVLLLALSEAVVWFGVRLQSERAEQDAEVAAVVAARQLVVNLISTDPGHAPDSFSRLVDSATGDFAQQLRDQSGAFVQAVRGADVTTRGSVAEAGVVQGDARQVIVLVSADSFVRNKEVPAGETRQYRFRLTVADQDGRWLVSRLELVP